jgi:tetratricopeptide (TPR) repeat protein
MDFKSTATAFLAVVMFSLPGAGRAGDHGGRLMDELAAAPDAAAAARLEQQLMAEWSKSGSAAMDLLLKRGRDALEVEDLEAAQEHFTALTDHAPDFAEGWHGLALAYYQAGRFGPAMDALERVLALNPQHFAALRGVGAINEQVGRSALAYEAYLRVLELRPHDEETLKAMQRLEGEVRGVTL